METRPAQELVLHATLLLLEPADAAAAEPVDAAGLPWMLLPQQETSLQAAHPKTCCCVPRLVLSQQQGVHPTDCYHLSLLLLMLLLILQDPQGNCAHLQLLLPLQLPAVAQLHLPPWPSLLLLLLPLPQGP
jgi:hypothetical protein